MTDLREVATDTAGFCHILAENFALLFLCPPTVVVYWNGLFVDRKQQAAMALIF
jgi:hypothetical protein